MSRKLTNAKSEFEQHTHGKEVLAAYITVDDDNQDEITKFTLYKDFTTSEKEEFLKGLDFNYDSGFGSQKIDGNIWYKDGTFSDRAEYDGSEWWTHIEMPPIPQRPNKE